MKCSKRKLRVYEVPISYHGRTYEEGKKIGWKDGVKALGVILYFWVVDDLYEANYGRGLLNSLTGTPQYISWVTACLAAAPGRSRARNRRGPGKSNRPADGAQIALRGGRR